MTRLVETRSHQFAPLKPFDTLVIYYDTWFLLPFYTFSTIKGRSNVTKGISVSSKFSDVVWSPTPQWGNMQHLKPRISWFGRTKANSDDEKRKRGKTRAASQHHFVTGSSSAFCIRVWFKFLNVKDQRCCLVIHDIHLYDLQRWKSDITDITSTYLFDLYILARSHWPRQHWILTFIGQTQ